MWLFFENRDCKISEIFSRKRRCVKDNTNVIFKRIMEEKKGPFEEKGSSLASCIICGRVHLFIFSTRLKSFNCGNKSVLLIKLVKLLRIGRGGCIVRRCSSFDKPPWGQHEDHWFLIFRALISIIRRPPFLMSRKNGQKRWHKRYRKISVFPGAFG